MLSNTSNVHLDLFPSRLLPDSQRVELFAFAGIATHLPEPVQICGKHWSLSPDGDHLMVIAWQWSFDGDRLAKASRELKDKNSIIELLPENFRAGASNEPESESETFYFPKRTNSPLVLSFLADVLFVFNSNFSPFCTQALYLTLFVNQTKRQKKFFILFYTKWIATIFDYIFNIRTWL